MAWLSENPKKVTACFKTDAGVKRKENEDCFVVIDDRNERYDTGSLGMLFAVADGMSGHKGGATASRMACEGLLEYYSQQGHSIGTQDFAKSRLKNLKDVFHKVLSTVF